MYALDPPAVDFGEVPLNTELTTKVVIRNTGEIPLTIVTQKASCKCTTMESLIGKIIDPGSSLELIPVIEPQSYPGTKKTRITIRFKEIDEPAVLWMVSRAAGTVKTEPAYISAVRPMDDNRRFIAESEAGRRERMTGDLVVRAIDEQPFRILAVDGKTPPYLDFDPATDEPKSSYTLAWDFTAYNEETCMDDDGRAMPAWWVIETDHPQAPIVDVRVRHFCCLTGVPASRSQQWILSDLRRVLGVMRPGETVEFTVGLKWLREARPNDTIRRIETDSDQFSVQLVDVLRDGDELTCVVELTPRPDHRGLLYGTCRFHGFVGGHAADLVIIGRVQD